MVEGSRIFGLAKHFVHLSPQLTIETAIDTIRIKSFGPEHSGGEGIDTGRRVFEQLLLRLEWQAEAHVDTEPGEQRNCLPWSEHQGLIVLSSDAGNERDVQSDGRNLGTLALSSCTSTGSM